MLTVEQSSWVASLAAEAKRRNARSTAAYSQLAPNDALVLEWIVPHDPLFAAVAGPLAISRRRGSRTWDIDGQEYIDVRPYEEMEESASADAELAAFVERLQESLSSSSDSAASASCPCVVERRGRQWRLRWTDPQPFGELLTILVRNAGVLLPEDGWAVLPPDYESADLRFVEGAMCKALNELLARGVLVVDGAPRPAFPQSEPTAARLAPGQEERWLAAHLDGESVAALNESFSVVFRGDVEVAALRCAVLKFVEHHDAFKVVFDLDEPLMRVLEKSGVVVGELDLRRTENPEAAFSDFALEASGTEFSLAEGPLAKFWIIRLRESVTALHTVASHLILDGWGAATFVAEVKEIYEATREGRQSRLKTATSLRQLSTELGSLFDSPQAAADIEYWASRLLAASATPISRTTPASHGSYDASTITRRFSGDQLQCLREFSRARGSTLFNVLMAAVATTIVRRTKQEEVLIFVPYAGQLLAGLNAVVGDGVIDLPVQMSVSISDPFEVVVEEARVRMLDTLEHPLVTRARILRAMGPQVAQSGKAFGAIYFNLNPPIRARCIGDAEIEIVEGPKTHSLTPVFFNFQEGHDHLALDLHYCHAFLDQSQAASLVDDLATALEAIGGTQAPECQLVEEETSDAQRPGDKPVGRRGGETIVEWINACLREDPTRVCVKTETEELSSSEFDRRAARIADALVQAGIRRGDLVGVCLGRSVNLLPSILGVLRTGAAYVPLDPHFPIDRLEYMIRDSHLRTVLVDRSSEELIPRSSIPRILIEAHVEIPHLDPRDVASPEVPIDPESAAYVIYTSGSTGKPKGVAVPHRALVNFLESMLVEPGFEVGDRLLAVTTLSFDIAALELFLPIVGRGTAVLATREDAVDGERLIGLLERFNINCLQATPSTWHLLLEAGWKARLPMRALCGGEALSSSLARLLLEQAVELWNMYGPTETTVWSAVWRVTQPASPVPIGRPIARTQLWVLREDMTQCAPGEEGEIYIGGAGTALGYLGRPQLTNERFLKDPFNQSSTGLLYRTGDRGCVSREGVVLCLGRLDSQVKLRGFRIELGEIEESILTVPGVSRCVAAVHEFAENDKRLVAYIVAREGLAVSPEALRGHLAKTLPAYMIPQLFEYLEALPQLPNGKVDRGALKPPTPANCEADGIEETSESAEAEVARLMAAVLGIRSVRLDDNFFALGGHSLLAARLISRLGKRYGRFSLRTLFENPTPRKLARHLEAVSSSATQKHELKIPVLENPSHAPLTAMQERIRFLEELYPGRSVFNAPSVHRLRGALNVAALEQAIREMIRRQPTLRTAIVREADGRYVQQVREEVPFALSSPEDLSRFPPDQVDRRLSLAVEVAMESVIDLRNPPLFRYRLFRLSAEEHVFFFMPHHVIWDGWSFDVFYAELAELYSAYESERPPRLSALALTYADFAVWHNSWAKTPELQAQLEYWASQFEKHGNVAAPPVDFPDAVDAGRGDTVWVHFQPSDIAEIRAVASETASTMSIVLLATYSLLIADWVGCDSPTIAVPVRGRPTEDLERIMGFFNNLVPIRLPVQRELSVRSWISEVRKQMSAALENQDIPFELVVDRVLRNTKGGRRFYQAMFSFQDARDRVTKWGSLSHERYPAFQKSANEALNFWAVEVLSGLEAGFQFNTAFHRRASVELIGEHFLSMLRRLRMNVDNTLGEIVGGKRSSDRVSTVFQARSQLDAAPSALSSREPRGAGSESEVAMVFSSPKTVVRPRIAADERAGDSIRPVTSNRPPPGQGKDDQQYLDSQVSDTAEGDVAPFEPLSMAVDAFCSELSVTKSDEILCDADVAPALSLLASSVARQAGASFGLLDDAGACAAPRRTLANAATFILFASANGIRAILGRREAYARRLIVVFELQSVTIAEAIALKSKNCEPFGLLTSPSLSVPLAGAWVGDARLPALRSFFQRHLGAYADSRLLPVGFTGDLALLVGAEGIGEKRQLLNTELRGRVRPDGSVEAQINQVEASLSRPEAVIASTKKLNEWEPTSKAEKDLAAIWESVLGISGVSRSDNFFSLGGSSLLAMSVVDRLEEETGYRMAVGRLPYESLAQVAASIPSSAAVQSSS